MKLSKHNIYSKLKDSDEFYIVNLLSGEADIINASEASKIESGQLNLLDKAYLDKGYVVEEDDEERRFKQGYLDFIDGRDSDEVQLFFVPTYACNFSCSYCYQEDYANQVQPLSIEIIDAFFKYVDQEFKNRNKYITLFGGEPLLASEAYKEKLNYFIDQSNKRNLEIAIVTNGYLVSDYIDVLKKAKIREIQITLDGTAEVHNSRRMLKSKQGTFDQIVEGVDACLQNGISVNMRMVVDKENLSNLPELARFTIDKGWTVSQLFKTQLGRNYELHSCQSDQKKLFTRLELYEELYGMIQEYPEILAFHRPAFSIANFLFENGNLPEPLYDSCTGCTTEWAFDYSGHIYSCTATVGKAEESLGTFYPTINKNEDLIEEWEDRDVLSIEECKTCSVRLACGGGCASVSKNITGYLHSPDCRPIKDLLSLGISVYSKE